MGTGVIKPNISTLMGITYDQQTTRAGEVDAAMRFQYFYMSINIGAFMSQMIVPVVRDQTGSYLIAFMVPAVFMIVALALFAAGQAVLRRRRREKEGSRKPPEQTVAKIRVLGQVSALVSPGELLLGGV